MGNKRNKGEEDGEREDGEGRGGRGARERGNNLSSCILDYAPYRLALLALKATISFRGAKAPICTPMP